MKEELAWIDTYLFNKPPIKNEAFKNESPLANLLKIEKAKVIENGGEFKSTKVGNAEVYDLGGNVAEYSQTSIYEYGAYDFYDVNNNKTINSNYVGIRIIKE